MKKNLLALGMAAFLCSSASAQSYRLCTIASDDDIEVEHFAYDDKGRFNRVHHEDQQIVYYDTLAYNDKNQIEVDYAYQDRQRDGNYAITSKCCYGYDEAGNMAWRDNYNSYGGELTQSARITYEYAKGHLVCQRQYWAFDLDNPFAVIDYVYNDAWQLTAHYVKYADFFDPSAFEESSKAEYEYDQQGQLVKLSFYNVDEGEYVLANTEEYDYDALGNVTEVRSRTDHGVNSRNVFHYDTSVDGSQILYPGSHEYNIGLTLGLKSKLTAQDVYIKDADDDTGEPVFAYTRHYSYEPCGTSKVATLASREDWVDARAKVVHLGSDAPCTVSVYGRDGKLVLSLNARGTADLSTLPAGMYIVSVRGLGGAASHHKVVLQ